MKKSSVLRKVSLILAAVLLLAAFSACGGSPGTANSTTAAVQSAQSGGTQATTEKAKEKVNLTIAWNEAGIDTSQNKDWPYEVNKYIFDKTGVTYSITAMDEEKYKVLLAGGDLPDILFNAGSNYLTQLIEGSQIIPLDDLVKTNGPDIMKNVPDTVGLMKQFISNATGKLYALGNTIGSAGHPLESQVGYYIKWDYYKELGYPEIKSDEDLVNVLAEMKKRHPKTPDGKPVYATATHNEWGPMWGFNVNCYAQGFAQFATSTYFISFKDSSLINAYTDTANSPFWKRMHFFYLLNQKGLLDPDTFTMKVADLDAKWKNGQYLFDIVNIFSSGYNDEAFKKDKNTISGYCAIPVEGTTVWDNQSTKLGWKYWTITTNCKYPDRAMDLINYYYSSECARLIYSGIKGEEWDVVDGKPALLPKGYQTYSDVDLNAKVGLRNAYYQLCGLSAEFICDDGEKASLFNTDAAYKETMKTAMSVDKDYCAYYKVDYPYQVMQNAINQGIMMDESKANPDLGTLTPPAPDDIKRIENAMEAEATMAVPKLCLAKSDAEFTAVQNKLISDLKGLGLDKVDAFYMKAYNDTKDAYAKAIGK